MTALELRLALKRLRLRQGAFAQLLGVHRVTVGRWVNSELEVPRYVAAYLELAERCAVVGVWDLNEVA
jgi:DNA-binding transcriptional regulator YiaG